MGAFISREDYIRKTLILADESTSEGYKVKYWELAGRALGYLEPPKIENQNIAVFQSISGDMIAFLKKQHGEFERIPTEVTTVKAENEQIQKVIN